MIAATLTRRADWRFSVTVTGGHRELLERRARMTGLSIERWIAEALEAAIARDGGGQRVSVSENPKPVRTGRTRSGRPRPEKRSEETRRVEAWVRDREHDFTVADVKAFFPEIHARSVFTLSSILAQMRKRGELDVVRRGWPGVATIYRVARRDSEAAA